MPNPFYVPESYIGRFFRGGGQGDIPFNLRRANEDGIGKFERGDRFTPSDGGDAAMLGSFSSLMGDLDGGEAEMGDLFKTLLFLQGRNRGGQQEDPLSKLFSGIQL